MRGHRIQDKPQQSCRGAMSFWASLFSHRQEIIPMLGSQAAKRTVNITAGVTWDRLMLNPGSVIAKPGTLKIFTYFHLCSINSHWLHCSAIVRIIDKEYKYPKADLDLLGPQNVAAIVTWISVVGKGGSLLLDRPPDVMQDCHTFYCS